MKACFGMAALALGLMAVANAYALTHDSAAIAVRQAVCADADEAKAAIATLREQGPAGLEILLNTFAAEIKAHNKAGAAAELNPQQAEIWERIRHAIDEVSAQRDCHVSHLYWYTDMDKALAAAKASGKPILSLRMLGKLNEEYSCANSRFFRSTLYSNAEVSQYLREHFILYWKSVRPVPRITIDMGDGRKIERTITGNSIHYILDCHGRPVDALPGLYGPKAFLTALARAHDEAIVYAKFSNYAAVDALRTYHSKCLVALATEWKADLAAVGVNTRRQVVQPRAAAPTAVAAGNLSTSKSGAERPMLATLLPEEKQNRDLVDDAVWEKIAQRHAEDATLDAPTIALMGQKNPDALQAGKVAMSKRAVESPLLREVTNLQHSIALDSVRNEYLLHSKIHQWFIAASAPLEVDPLNERVYADLFLTPNSDPWLGLVPADTYTALDHNGLVVAK